MSWIFTFGSGQPNAGHYVKISGDYDSARQEMIDRYGLEWAFQYSEQEWNDWVNSCIKNGTEWLLEVEL